MVQRRDHRECVVDTIELVGEQQGTGLTLADVDVADVGADQRHSVAHMGPRLLEPSETQQELGHVRVQPCPARPQDPAVGGPAQAFRADREGLVDAPQVEQHVRLVDVQASAFEQPVLPGEAACVGEGGEPTVVVAEAGDDALGDQGLQLFPCAPTCAATCTASSIGPTACSSRGRSASAIAWALSRRARSADGSGGISATARS